MNGDEEALLTEQRAYYRAVAGEYDLPYAQRRDLRTLTKVLDDLPISGDVLELACGTGQWTRELAARARSVTAMDAAPEMLEIAQARVTTPNVEFVQADMFAWRPERHYDTVFFAFWLSHIPPSRLPAFWTAVASMLTPGGSAVFIDDGPAEAAAETLLTGQPAPAALRRLSDGSHHRIVKVFHDPAALTSDLTAQGWSASIHPAENTFIIGTARPRLPDPRPRPTHDLT